MNKENNKMKAAIVETKDINDIKIIEKDIPSPKENQVLVKLVSSTIHPSDMLRFTGVFGIKVDFPTQSGLDGYGLVVKDGDSSNKYINKYVSFWSLNTYSWAEYCIVDKKDLLITPNYTKDENGLKHASNFYLNPLTALGLLDYCKKNNHTSICINGGHSQVSRMLIKLCKKESINVIALVRKENQVKYLYSIGANEVLNINENNFESKLNNLASNLKVSLFIDCVKGSQFIKELRNMPDGCSTLYYGFLSGETESEEDVNKLKKEKNIDFKGMLLFNKYVYSLNEQEKKEVSDYISKEIDGLFSTEFNKSYNFIDIKKAIEEYSKNSSSGKVVIEF